MRLESNGVYTLYDCFDLEGNPIKKNKYDYPYSYDAFVIYLDDHRKSDQAVYSDRLYQWDYKKAERISTDLNQHLHSYHVKDPVLVEKWLCLYMGKIIKLTAIMEGCNQSTGYAYWIYFYREEI